MPFLGTCSIIGGICLVGVILLTNQRCWFRLAKGHPDRPDEPILRLRRLSAKLGRIRMTGLFILSVYSDGAYVGVEPLFGLFRSGADTFAKLARQRLG